MSDAFARAINALDEDAFQSLYGRWDPLEPAQVAELFQAAPVRWWIAGGRAARAGAAARHHEDTDIAVSIDDLDNLREHLSGWHLWEAHNGTLRPLLPGDTLTPGCEQLWARRDAQHPWELDLLLDRSHDQWTFKRDPRIRVPWQRALHNIDGIPYLRPELALLHKATSTGPKTSRTWPLLVSIPAPGPGWPRPWNSLATTRGPGQPDLTPMIPTATPGNRKHNDLLLEY